jgi:hypothetical protein
MSKVYRDSTTTESAVIPITRTALEALAQVFVIENPLAVSAFLDHNPDLAPLLLEAHDAIERYFPDSSGTPSVLRVVIDPELIAQQDLVLAILPQVDPEEAFTRFMAFMDGWWLDAQARAATQLIITTEYQ